MAKGACPFCCWGPWGCRSTHWIFRAARSAVLFCSSCCWPPSRDSPPGSQVPVLSHAASMPAHGVSRDGRLGASSPSVGAPRVGVSNPRPASPSAQRSGLCGCSCVPASPRPAVLPWLMRVNTPPVRSTASSMAFSATQVRPRCALPCFVQGFCIWIGRLQKFK